MKGDHEMAKIVQAVNQYGPKLELGPTAQLDELADWMASRTGLNKSEAMMLFQEMSEMILAFNMRGVPVKIPGVGIFSPSIDRHGAYKINVRNDVALKKGSSAPDAYKGAVKNAERIGLDNAGYKALWDADHPDDPLEV
jgi:nucleoid DNA-binding protein